MDPEERKIQEALAEHQQNAVCYYMRLTSDLSVVCCIICLSTLIRYHLPSLAQAGISH
jgi:hypothetical protein